MRFRKAQSLSNFHRQKHLIEHIVTKFGFKKCCGCEHADECDVFGKIREEFASRSMNLPQDGEICCTGSSIIWNRFIQSQNLMVKNDHGDLCHGRTAIKILKHYLELFQSEQDIIDLLKSPHCWDGVPKTQEVCERSWRAEMCQLCPLNGREASFLSSMLPAID